MFNLVNSCTCGCQSKSRETLKKNIFKCPVCGHISKKVPLDVVFNFAKKELKKKLKSSDYYICLNPDCKVSYFNINEDLIKVDDIRRPIWFKKGAEPKIICYCNNITEKQIKEAVREHDLKTWEEIVLHYRKTKICACNKLNPMGECCTETFNKIINETLVELNKKRIENSNQCCGK